jgi:hypothetical protein
MPIKLEKGEWNIMILEKKLQKRPFEVTITSVATKPRAT